MFVIEIELNQIQIIGILKVASFVIFSELFE